MESAAAEAAHPLVATAFEPTPFFIISGPTSYVNLAFARGMLPMSRFR